MSELSPTTAESPGPISHPYSASLQRARRILFIVGIWFLFSALVFAPQAPPQRRVYAYGLKATQIVLTFSAAVALKHSRRAGQALAWLATLATLLDFPVGMVAAIALVFYLAHAGAKGSFSASNPNAA